jgi:hypothetical protein
MAPLLQLHFLIFQFFFFSFFLVSDEEKSFVRLPPEQNPTLKTKAAENLIKLFYLPK